MNNFLRNAVVDAKQYDAFCAAINESVLSVSYEDSSLYNKTQGDLEALLRSHATAGGIGTGDFYMSEDWYGHMTFGVVLNTGKLVAETPLKSVAVWASTRGFPCSVFFGGCGLAVSPQLQIAVGMNGVRICWRGQSLRKCLDRISKQHLGL